MYPDTAFVFDFKRSIVGASNRSVVIVVAALVVLMVESDVYINKSQRECVIQCQILSSWVVTQPLLLAVETRLSSSSSSSSTCSRDPGHEAMLAC